jgi:hypothetical protein
LQAEHDQFELDQFNEVFADTLGAENAGAPSPVTLEFPFIQF